MNVWLERSINVIEERKGRVPFDTEKLVIQTSVRVDTPMIVGTTSSVTTIASPCWDSALVFVPGSKILAAIYFFLHKPYSGV